jgi:hypothetical protein
MDDDVRIRSCFLLGVAIAEHVHGIIRKRDDGKTVSILRTLQEIADGSLTLVETPTEMMSGLPPVSPGLAKGAVKALKGARNDEKAMAVEIWNALPPLMRGLLSG